MKRDAAMILRGAISKTRDYCTGAGFAPTDCYLTAPMVSIGIAPCLPLICGSAFLNQTMAYDAAEANVANLGQTNMIAVSSFCGINGLVLGHDLLKVDPIPHELAPTFKGMPVFNISSLERATVSLFGTVGKPRFPLLPGEHVPCAYKTFSIEGKGVVWGALALAIAKDRGRNADLFMEELGGERGPDEIGNHEVVRIIDNLLRSITYVSHNLGVEYERVYLGLKQKSVPSAHQGCSLTAAPYFKIAQAAMSVVDPADLAHMTLDEWESKLTNI